VNYQIVPEGYIRKIRPISEAQKSYQ